MRGDLVFAAIAPHGGLVFGDPPEAPATRAALEELGRRFDAARPDVTIVLTPHNVHVEGHFAVVVAGSLAGDASEWTDAGNRHAALRSDVERHGARLEMLVDGSLLATVAESGNVTDQAVRAARCALALRRLMPDLTDEECARQRNFRFHRMSSPEK